MLMDMSAGSPTSSRPQPSDRPQITARGLGLTVLGYLVVGSFYAVTIGLTEQYRWTDIAGRIGLHYAIMGVITLPIWWLTVRILDTANWTRLFAAHAVTGPVFVGVSFAAYYDLLPVFGLSGLPPGFRQWDVFIPTLLYVLQFGAFHMVRYVQTLNAQAKRERELVALARDREMAALKAQLNPHFLFNAFNSISASVPPEMERTRTTIARLARLLRYTLRASDRRLVLLREELDFVRGYLAMEQDRFEERLQVEFDIDASALDVPVPPMLLQPLVENAVRHGIAPCVDGGAVRVAIRRSDAAVHVTVADTGRGTAQSAEDIFDDGLGLRATHRRLTLLHDRSLQIETAAGEGFAVRFDLPVLGASPAAPPAPATPRNGQPVPADPSSSDPGSPPSAGDVVPSSSS